MDTTHKLTASICVLLMIGSPALSFARAEGQGVQLTLSADASTVHAWGSCNLTARLTQDGNPLANVDVVWQVSDGTMEGNRSTTDQAGMASAQFTAVVAASHGAPGQVEVQARATVNGATYQAMTNITIDPKPVEWTGRVSYTANAGELYPGESLQVRVDIAQPGNAPCNFVANFTVEAYLYDAAENLLDTVVLGKGLSLFPGMSWSSGPKVLLQVPSNPTQFSYFWTFSVLTPHGTWVYYQPDHQFPVNVVTAGKDRWTYLVYLDGDNSLTDWTTDLFNGFEVTAPTGEFTVLVQWDMPGAATTRWKLLPDADLKNIHSLPMGSFPNVDSGSYHTVLDFLDWGAANAPAQHYFLSMWDHGGGYYGTCWDDSSGTNLPNQWLKVALENFTQNHRKVDILNLDVCLEGGLEPAYLFKDFANYLLACEIVLDYDILNPAAFTKLKAFGQATPTPRQVVGAVMDSYREVNGDNSPITAMDLSAASQVAGALDTLGTSLLKKWPAVKKWIHDAWETSPAAGADTPEWSTLMDARAFFQRLRQDMGSMPLALAEQISAVNNLLSYMDAMTVDRVFFKEFTGLHVFFPPSTGVYKTEKPVYLLAGFPETSGWVQVIERLYLPVKYAVPGMVTYYPQVQGFANYEVANAGMFSTDSDHDGHYESLAVNVAVNQTGNLRPVTVVVDLLGFNGTKAARYGSLEDRKAFPAAAGASMSENVTLTSASADTAEVVLSVLADDGTPVQRLGIGRFWMNATNRTGPAPGFNLTASAMSVTEGQAVNFTATPSGQNLTLWWDFDCRNGVGIDATGPSASIVYRGGWNRTVTCIASDGSNVAVRTLAIEVRPDTADRQPVANLTALFLDPAHPLKVTLNASRTTDTDGEPVQFLFDFGDENLTGWASGAVVEYDYAAPGNYDCAVMVRDHTAYNGSLATVTVRPGTTPVTLPPVAALKLSAAKVGAGKAVTLDASGSSDPGGSALRYRIVWGDGNVTDWTGSANTTHAYAKAGIYTVQLTVRNQWDLAAFASSAVTVTPKPKTEAKGFIPGMMLAPAVVALALAAVIAGNRKRK
jgi:PKD repeat protein